MSDNENIENTETTHDDDVEGHLAGGRTRNLSGGRTRNADEGDDVEGHLAGGRTRNAEGDDDVEAHKAKKA